MKYLPCGATETNNDLHIEAANTTHKYLPAEATKNSQARTT
jgi:hypothetical protein